MNTNFNHTENIIAKYLIALRDLRVVLRHTEKMNITDFLREHQLSSNLSTVLQEGGVIAKVGGNKAATWRWITVEPSREMAIRALDSMSLQNNNNYTDKLPSENEPVKRRVKKEKEKPAQVTYVAKIFFGLIKIKFLPVT